MKKVSELVLAGVVILLIVLKLDPFRWFMPSPVQLLLLCILIAALALYAGAIFREKPHDEREESHLYRASRVGYLAGIISLSVVFVIKDLQKEPDPLLLLVLAVMLITKLVVLKYSRHRH